MFKFNLKLFLFIEYPMDKNNEKGFINICPINPVKSEEDEMKLKIHLLERKVEELTNMMVLLQERITSLERTNYRSMRGPSFLTGDPFMFPPEQG
jgi:hypothetical protein